MHLFIITINIHSKGLGMFKVPAAKRSTKVKKLWCLQEPVHDMFTAYLSRVACMCIHPIAIDLQGLMGDTESFSNLYLH